MLYAKPYVMILQMYYRKMKRFLISIHLWVFAMKFSKDMLSAMIYYVEKNIFNYNRN